MDKDSLKEVGELIGVTWDEVVGPRKGEILARKFSLCFCENMKIIYLNVRGIGVDGKLGWVKSIIRDGKLQETKGGIVDELWVEEVWGNRGFGFTQLIANGNSDGIILIWDANTFVCKEAMGDERFVAVK
ncbi:hypothetical protein Tco_1514010, partial [Tanacetum coccineum]